MGFLFKGIHYLSVNGRREIFGARRVWLEAGGNAWTKAYNCKIPANVETAKRSLKVRSSSVYIEL